MIILLGTRGQLLKMAPVIWELDKRKIDYTFVTTYQHPKACEKLREIFKIKHPNLWYERTNDLKSIKDMIRWWFENLYGMTALFRFCKIGNGELIVIHGDTMSTLFGLIIGKLFHMKIAHIESGYRSYSLLHPFPEEIIRRLACKFSDILFAPGDWAVHNLRTEHSQIVNTYQNTIFDLLNTITTKANNGEKYIVATIHRQETLYNHNLLIKVIYAIQKAKEIVPVKFILHPLTEERLKYYHIFEDLLMWDYIELLPIQEYTKFMNLIANSEFVITDGGGLQEETYFLNKPCLLLRKRTEKRVGLGETAYLSEFDYEKIDYFFEHWQSFRRKWEFIHKHPSKIIVDCLEKEV